MTTPGTLSRVGRHTVIYAIGALLGKAVAFVMLPLYTRYLTPADYGVVQLIDMTLEVISIVAGSRLAAGVFHLYHKLDDDGARKRLLASAFLLLAGAFIVAGLVSWAGASIIARLVLGDERLAPLVRIAAASLSFQCLILIPLAEVQLRERSRIFVATNAVKLVVQVTLNVVLLVRYHLGAEAVLIGWLVGNMVIGLPLGISFVRRVGLRWDGNAVRDVLRLGLPFIGVQLAKFIQTFGDRYFLRALVGMATVGVYGLGYQFGFLLSQVGYVPFITAWEPMRFAIARRADRDAVFNRVFLLMNLVLITAAVGITLFVGDFLRLAATPAFFGAAAVVPIVLVAYIFQSWFGFHNFGLFFGERTGLITLANWIGAIVALVFYAMLIPDYGAMGAAWATLLSFAASELVVYREAQRVCFIRYEWGPTLRLSAIAVVVSGVALALPDIPMPWSPMTHAALVGLYLVLVWFGGVLTREDKQRLSGVRLSAASIVAAFTRA